MVGVQGETSGELLDFSLLNTDDRVDGVYLSCLVGIPDWSPSLCRIALAAVLGFPAFESVR